MPAAGWSAALTAAIDATTEASSGRISITLADLESNTASALSVQFDHGDYMVSADSPALPMLEDFEVRHIDGTTFGAEGGGVWSVIMPPTDTFDATRILDEQNAALSALAGLQACTDDANAFCGTVDSAALVDQLMLVDRNVNVVTADVRVTVADGFVDRVDLHVVRPGRRSRPRRGAVVHRVRRAAEHRGARDRPLTGRILAPTAGRAIWASRRAVRSG